MEFKLFGLDLVAWKLHTAKDYTLFFALCIGIFLLFAYLTKRMGRKRDDAHAVAKTQKLLGKLSKKKYCVLPASECALPAGSADLVLFAPDGIYLCRCFGWGFKISGALRTPTWRVRDNKSERRIENPIIALKPQIDALASALEKNGIDADVSHLIVFADPFGEPSFSLEYGANSFGPKSLKEWYKSLEPSGYDVEKAVGLIKK